MLRNGKSLNQWGCSNKTSLIGQYMNNGKLSLQSGVWRIKYQDRLSSRPAFWLINSTFQLCRQMVRVAKKLYWVSFIGTIIAFVRAPYSGLNHFSLADTITLVTDPPHRTLGSLDQGSAGICVEQRKCLDLRVQMLGVLCIMLTW